MKTQLTLAMAAAAACLTLTNISAIAGDVQGDAYGCNELWSLRNQIFKANGYCFKSPKAIKLFGNAGCKFDAETAVPLSDQDRQTLIAIKKSERRQSCKV